MTDWQILFGDPLPLQRSSRLYKPIEVSTIASPYPYIKGQRRLSKAFSEPVIEGCEDHVGVKNLLPPLISPSSP